MEHVREQSKDQARWNQHGTTQLREIEENPDRHIIRASPYSHLTVNEDLMMMLSPLQDKEVLELGSGDGRFSVFLSRQGAKVTGVDVGPDLVAASEALARVNQVSCRFQQCNVTKLPFQPDAYDIVVGMSILHHLSPPDVVLALSESSRVLKPSGVAVFYEPVENSKLFDFIQNLFPTGAKGCELDRPSILQRRAWREYLLTLDDRSMTSKELIAGGNRFFRSTHLSPYGLVIRLERLVGHRYGRLLNAVDGFMFMFLPPLRRYCQTVLVVCRR